MQLLRPGISMLWSYVPVLSRSRESTAALHGPNGCPPDSLSVRLCYGTEEVQRTRHQQPSYGYQRACYDFYENFTLTVEPRPHVEFRVELRDETLGPLGSDTV